MKRNKDRAPNDGNEAAMQNPGGECSSRKLSKNKGPAQEQVGGASLAGEGCRKCQRSRLRHSIKVDKDHGNKSGFYSLCAEKMLENFKQENEMSQFLFHKFILGLQKGSRGSRETSEEMNAESNERREAWTGVIRGPGCGHGEM